MMNDYRCRVSEDELAHDHAQIEITAEDEREAAREDIELLALDINEAIFQLLRNKDWQPDSDDIESAEALYNCLRWHMTPAQREAV
tara:strand:+ start:217 stop:474 length:258 start_codon:yes stop_codon:yes gene_type:complete